MSSSDDLSDDRQYDPFAADESVGEPLFSVRRLTQLALVLLVALTVARGTMMELVRDPFEVSPGQQYTPTGPGAGVMVTINLLFLVPAGLVLLRRVLDREGYELRPMWGGLLFVGTGVLAVASTVWAGDKYLALVSATTWLAAGTACWTAGQVVRSWARLRLVAAVMAGLLLVYCAQGLFYQYVELKDLQATVERTKDRLLEERGFKPGTFAAEQFLRRISAGEMIGFGSSPNSYAATLVLLGVITGGLLAQAVASRRDAVLAFMLPVGLGLAVWAGSFTRSTTAVATPILAAGIVAGAWLLRKHAMRYRKALFAAGALVVLLGGAAVVAHGVYHGGLPGASMNFRWRYWTGAWGMVEANPWLGVGWANFGSPYLEFRVPAAAEEIRDPHNFLVRFATELGLMGLAACVMWQAVAWWGATRPVVRVPGRRGLPVGAVGLAAACTLGVLINIVSSVDFRADWQFGVIECFKRLMYLGCLVVGGALTLIVSRTSGRADEGESPWVLWACAAGCGVFLLHNLVDFSLFEPSAGVMFAVVLGAVMGVRSSGGTREGGTGDGAGTWAGRGGTGTVGVGAESGGVVARWGAGVGLGAVVMAGVVGAVWLGRPVVRAEGIARGADELLRVGKAVEAAAGYKAALGVVSWNGEYAEKSARSLLMARVDLEEVRRLLDEAMRLDPRGISPLLDRARLEFALPSGRGDWAMSVELLGRAVRANPGDLSIRREYAAGLERVGRPGDAAAQYREVLRYDGLLDPTEPKRLGPDEKAEVEGHIARLTPLPLQGTGTTRP